MGRSGYRALVSRMLALKQTLLAGLAQFPQLVLIDSPQNTFGFCIAESVDTATRTRLSGLFNDSSRYVLRYSHLPVGTHEGWDVCRPVYKVLVMPHLDEAKVGMFIADIASCLANEPD